MHTLVASSRDLLLHSDALQPKIISIKNSLGKLTRARYN